MAINNSSGDVYIATSERPSVAGWVWVFTAKGEYVERWNVPFPGERYPNIAVDNSGESTQGDVYLTRANGTIAALGPGGQAVPFSATAEYISGNEITGTPKGAFPGPLGGITVDPNGNIYVIANSRVVDEFESSGKFVREFETAGEPGNRRYPQGLAVDSHHRQPPGRGRCHDDRRRSGTHGRRRICPDRPLH